MRTSFKDIALQYFVEHPQAKENLLSRGETQPAIPETWREFYMRIYGEIPDFAQHKNNGYYRDLDKTHPTPNIHSIIKKEEMRYISLLKRNTSLIKKKYSDIKKLDGQTLAFLHHTHGCDPNMVEEVLDIFLPENLHQEYLSEYERHKRTGRNNNQGATR